jgi:hypothetical protein
LKHSFPTRRSSDLTLEHAYLHSDHWVAEHMRELARF